MTLHRRYNYLKLIITVCLLITLVFVGRLGLTVQAATENFENENTVYIENAEDLNRLSDLRYSGKLFSLKCDIDYFGSEWKPIDTYRMSGTFDGCGHIIKNFIIESSGTYTGMFSQNKLNIKNLFISDVIVKNGENSGILAGLNLGDITNVHISGELRSEDNAGGLIAENYGRVNNCSFDGNVSGRKAGGLISLNESEAVINSYSKGKVSGQITGGLIASVMSTRSGEAEITNCFSFCELVQIEISESAKRAGGFIGIRDSSITVANCFAGNDYPAISLGDFEGVKELDQAKRENKSTFTNFDFENYWYWDEEKNEIIQRTIAVSSNICKVEGKEIIVEGNKAFYIDNETVILRLNTYKSNPNIGLAYLKVFGEDVTEQIKNGDYRFDLNDAVKNIAVDFNYLYLLKIEINIYSSQWLSLEKDKKYFTPGEEIIFIVKEQKGYKNPAPYAVFNGEEVVFTDISTDGDKNDDVKRFKAEINSDEYSSNDMLYVSVRYEEVNNLWWILLLSIGLPLLLCVAVAVTVIIIKHGRRIKVNER